MSYEKYIKYKTKYLNLKAEIHNRKIQLGGENNILVDNDFIQTLGSTPNSNIFNNNNYDLIGGGKEKSETDVNLPDKLSSSSSESSKNSSSSSSDNLPNKLSSSESSEKKNDSDKSVKTTESFQNLFETAN